jgi:hypothetical protein
MFGSFSVRMYLEGVPYPEGYNALHNAMELRGFTKERPSDDGRTFEVLPGTYDIDGDYTDEQVREMALVAAWSLGYTAKVDVYRVVSRAWSGLRQVTPEPFRFLNVNRPNPAMTPFHAALFDPPTPSPTERALAQLAVQLGRTS